MPVLMVLGIRRTDFHYDDGGIFSRPMVVFVGHLNVGAHTIIYIPNRFIKMFNLLKAGQDS